MVVRIPPSLGNSAACGWCYQSRMLIAVIHGLGIIPSPGRWCLVTAMPGCNSWAVDYADGSERRALKEVDKKVKDDMADKSVFHSTSSSQTYEPGVKLSKQYLTMRHGACQ